MSEFYGDILTDDENENENIFSKEETNIKQISIEYKIIMYNLQLNKNSITNKEKHIIASNIINFKKELENTIKKIHKET